MSKHKNRISPCTIHDIFHTAVNDLNIDKILHTQPLGYIAYDFLLLKSRHDTFPTFPYPGKTNSCWTYQPKLDAHLWEKFFLDNRRSYRCYLSFSFPIAFLHSSSNNGCSPSGLFARLCMNSTSLLVPTSAKTWIACSLKKAISEATPVCSESGAYSLFWFSIDRNCLSLVLTRSKSKNL